MPFSSVSTRGFRCYISSKSSVNAQILLSSYKARCSLQHYFTLVSTKRFPNIQQVTSDTPITVSTANYFWLLSQLNAKDHPFFWDPDTQYQKDFSEYLLPQGLLFTFHPESAANHDS